MRWPEITPPSQEPVSLTEARIHLRQQADNDSPNSGDSPQFFDDVPDDSWIQSNLTACRQSCEDYLGYPLTDAVYLLVFQDWSGRLYEPNSRQRRSSDYYSGPYSRGQPENCLPTQDGGIQLPPMIGDVVMVQYLDPVSNHPMQLSMSGFDFDPVTGILYNDQPWPAVSTRAGAVRMQVQGIYGYDSPSIKCPETVKQAIKLMLAEWYENRGLSIDGRIAEISLGVEFLLRPLRTRLGMA